MPITPKFTVTQDDSYVIVTIQTPHIRVSQDSLQIVMEDNNQILHFASPPYLLVLQFTQSFSETADEECATYDPLSGTVVLKLEKKEKRVQWPDLDLLGTLMQQQKQQASCSRWIQQVIHDDDEKNDIIQESHIDIVVSETGYGFLRMFRGIFSDLARDGLAKEMLESPWDETDNAPDVYQRRRKRRIKQENQRFSLERYVQDLDVEEDYIYQCAMAMNTPWQETAPFDVDENLALSTIPYPILPTTIPVDKNRHLVLGLVDILFAYVYDHLITDGDPTVESSWCISTISATLAWLEDWQDTSLFEVVRSTIRRSLLYPYIRNLDFSLHVLAQVEQILKQGSRVVLRCLLQTRSILDQSEFYYLGNKLFIDAYLIWVQKYSSQLEPLFSDVAAEINQIKSNTDWTARSGLPLAADVRDDCSQAASDKETDEWSSGSDSDDEEDPDSEENSVDGNEGTKENTSSTKLTESLLDDEIGFSSLKISEPAADRATDKSNEGKMIQEMD